MKHGGTLKPESVSTKQERIAELAKNNPARALTTLAHHIDYEWVKYAYDCTRNDGAVGVDGQTGENGGRWVLDVDVRNFFDSIPHAKLREFLARRVTDGVVRKLIDKWLTAGVLENGQLSFSEAGAPQGGVASPLLANVFLHYVLDEWFSDEVQSRLRGPSTLVRFADDFVMLFAYKDGAERVLEVLGKRLGKYGLELHPDKTSMVDFRHKPKPAKGLADSAAIDGKRSPGSYQEGDQSAMPGNAALVSQRPTPKALPDAKVTLRLFWHQW
jgi:hypothetical protein